MSDSYSKVKGGRLSFKGGDLATRSKSIHKPTKKKKKTTSSATTTNASAGATTSGAVSGDGATEVQQGVDDVYTIDPMKKMKYDELFPVECKKFGYDPKAKAASVESALDDRVKKKADRYCK